MKAKRPPGFLNVDLEIVSRSKLDRVERAVSALAYPLYSGPLRKGIYVLVLECNSCPKNADAAILALCTAVEQLGGAERRLWDRALSRTFDVGYHFQPATSSVHVIIQPETLKRVITLSARIGFTCYKDIDL